jgi:hypothetical protein
MKIEKFNILFRIYRFKYYFLNKLYKNELGEIYDLIYKFSAYSGYNKSPELSERIVDLYLKIKREKIKSILEIGAGRTTVFFAYLKQKGVIHELITLEQDKLFLEKVNSFIYSCGLSTRLIHSNFIIDKNGHYLDYQPSDNLDMIYVDGPDELSRSVIYDTPDGKAICKDAVNYFKNNFFPKYIFFDGRVSSVDYTLSFTDKYMFFPGYRWAHKKNNFIAKLHFNRHSYFKLRKN